MPASALVLALKGLTVTANVPAPMSAVALKLEPAIVATEVSYVVARLVTYTLAPAAAAAALSLAALLVAVLEPSLKLVVDTVANAEPLAMSRDTAAPAALRCFVFMIISSFR